ncbi:hypothetical protein [Xenorhabdus koppenhoeferi]|uniref:Uncharacterized protein n=1 Tax=Xenorhabdus koppenhoeferi TaxID=351659 RepID=A0A1I7KN98_9GAMM|nr:hypothetical protein [Xenorhabdus koppenhoeferi]SFU98880.1 hypothetical protein SAMN05421784_1852 [Xenorhabdus koppenhoeferi]
MTQSTLLERKRKALIYAKLDTLKKKYGSYSEFIEVDNFNYRLDLDEEILTIALICSFERDVLAVNKKSEAEQLIVDTYNSFYTQFGNLTEDGNAFINEVLKLVARKTEPIKGNKK